VIEYRVLKEIENNPSHTQRSLARTLDISLGKANYVLAGLISKGVVRARRLRENPGKIRWQYILTPQGIREKLRITRAYLHRRLVEYERIQREIEELRAEVRDGDTLSVEPERAARSG
jgi:EPS-associated MarR family transcriptional regulator